MLSATVKSNTNRIHVLQLHIKRKIDNISGTTQGDVFDWAKGNGVFSIQNRPMGKEEKGHSLLQSFFSCIDKDGEHGCLRQCLRDTQEIPIAKTRSLYSNRLL